MKKEVVFEVGWVEDNVTAGPNWTGLLCLDVLMETEVAVVSESGAGWSASTIGPCVWEDENDRDWVRTVKNISNPQ